jgi:predicted alpha/beta-fold hydrolase
VTDAAGVFPPFAERPPWLTGDLQTLRNVIRRPFHDLSDWPEQRIELPLDDGDRLVAQIHRPSAPQALVVLIHGLGGDANSVYVRATARHLLSSGYAVVRLNLRGAGLSAAHCRSQYHAGRSEDVRAALARLKPSNGPFFAVGYSLGGNVLLKYLGEEGRGGPLTAAAAVSTPLDLAASSRRLLVPRNRFYQDYLVTRMKADALAEPDFLSAEERRRLRELRTIFEFDDRFVAPRHGFADAADYYARSSAGRYVGGIGVPTLVVHGLNDPWIPAESYTGLPWNGLTGVVPLLPRGGGHVGFHGVGSRIPWHDRCIALFFDRLVKQ